MPPNITGFMLIALVVFLGVLAILIIILVIAAWRRYNNRQPPTRAPQPYQDIWKIGGERLIARMDQSPPPPDSPQEPEQDQEPPDKR